MSIVRSLRRRSGTVASSPSFHCTILNRVNRTAKLNRSPITLPDLQGQALPPCCSTRNREQTAPSRSRTPRGSMLHSLVRGLSLWRVVSTLLKRKDSNTRSRFAAPIGTFLMVSSSVVHPLIIWREVLHPKTPPPAHSRTYQTSQYRSSASANT